MMMIILQFPKEHKDNREARLYLLVPSMIFQHCPGWDLCGFCLVCYSFPMSVFWSPQIHGDTVQNQLVVQGVELPSYLPLYSPAMDWIFQCISYHAPEVTVWRDSGATSRLWHDSPVLCACDVDRAFPSSCSSVSASLPLQSAQPGGWFSAKSFFQTVPWNGSGKGRQSLRRPNSYVQSRSQEKLVDETSSP